MHELQWIENRNQSESWGIPRCSKCHQTVSLEGVMNIQSLCKGETPWNGADTTSNTPCTDHFNEPSTMRVALVAWYPKHHAKKEILDSIDVYSLIPGSAISGH